jgi:tetratricopeptide (TPR) repeat protein
VKLRRQNIIVLFMLLFVAAGTFLVQRSTPKSKTENHPDSENNYVGDKACQSCHKAEYNNWLSSDHFKAMQFANDSTVLGDFNNRSYTADGVTSHFFKKDGDYFINTQGEDGNNHDYEIKYTFGYYPLQQYLIVFPNGRMQVTRQSWDSKAKKWFHQNAGQKIPSHDWLHWTGNAQNWNTMCSRCHSTNLQKNYDFASDSYNTTYDVLTVSCESCHGPGEKHIDYINSSDYKNGEKIANSYLSLTKKSDQTTQINTCAPCHMRAGEISNNYVHSNELLDNFIPEIPSTDFYYADGQMRDEDYNYASFLQSKMYSRGVKCSNCHNPHSGKVLFADNQLCLQCHAKKYDDISHTFHAANTEASLCKSCHMPGTVYMGNDLRHDHALRVPRPDLSVLYGTPNACNKCHADKSASWAADAVKKWYGPKRMYHFSEDLIPASKEDALTEGHVLRMMNDTATPAIIKATALYYLKNITTQNSLQILKKGLVNNDAQVRYRALRSLSNFPSDTWLNDVLPLLNDKARAVRIAAADLVVTLPATQIPSNYQNSFVSAKNELRNYVLYQTDFASGNLMAGDYFLKQNDYLNAERYYVRALKKDTAMNEARLNLSVVYNLSGKNDEALKVLREALKVSPRNDRIYFNLALLYNEMNDKAKAEESLIKAIALHSQNPRVYFNYGLLLQQKGKLSEAVIQLQKAVQLSPSDADLNYALCWLYVQSNQIEKAKQVAIVLKRLNANNPEYENLILQLGL